MITIAMAFDSGIYRGARSTIISTLISNRDIDLSFKILDGGLSEIQKNEIDRIISLTKNASLQWIKFDKLLVMDFSINLEFTHMTYARILLPDMISESSCIYLDPDLLVFCNLSELWKEIGCNPLAASIDRIDSLEKVYPWHKGIVTSPFINAGVMGMNLDIWRSEGLHLQMLELLRNKSAECSLADQTAINWILRDRIHILPAKFNTFPNSIDYQHVEFEIGRMIVHYASGKKPWSRPVPTISHVLWRYFDSRFTPKSKDYWNVKNIMRYVNFLLKKPTITPFLNKKNRLILDEYKAGIDKLISSYDSFSQYSNL